MSIVARLAGEKGLQIVKPAALTVRRVRRGKGFGFVASDDGGKDVFVHISVLRPAGIMQLAEGQAVQMRVVDTPKGREAISIALG